MLANPHVHEDTGALIIGGANYVCSLSDVSWSHETTTESIRTACNAGDRTQRTGQQATLAATMFGPGTFGEKTSGMDVSVLSLGGLDLFDYTYTLEISGTFEKTRLPGIGVFGMAEGISGGKGFTATLTLQPADGVGGDPGIVQSLVVANESKDPADWNVQLVVTINGKTISLPVQLNGGTYSSTAGEFQGATINLTGQAPSIPTLYPTLPSTLPGSPSLLELALLSPKQNLAFTYVSHTTEGIVRDGFLTWDGWSFSINQNEVLKYAYTWKTFGDWDAALN